MNPVHLQDIVLQHAKMRNQNRFSAFVDAARSCKLSGCQDNMVVHWTACDQTKSMMVRGNMDISVDATGYITFDTMSVRRFREILSTWSDFAFVFRAFERNGSDRVRKFITSFVLREEVFKKLPKEFNTQLNCELADGTPIGPEPDVVYL